MYDNPEDYAEILALSREVAATLPVSEAGQLSSISATAENGWVLAELAHIQVSGGNYDWWSRGTLCLTTRGDLVIRETAWYGDNDSTDDKLRPAKDSDLHLLDWPWSDTTAPHEGVSKGTNRSRGHFIYGHDRVAVKDFDGARDLLESRRG
jgi:hypothetical protein